MSRASKFLYRAVPAAFVAGTLFGVSITSIGAAFRGSAIFRDVPNTHYADEAIGEMYQLGIIKGYDSAHFGPDDPLTRGQAALLFKRLRDEIKGITSSVSSRTSSSTASAVSTSASSSSTSSSYNPGGSIRFDSNGYIVDKNVSTGDINIAIVRIGGNQGTGTIQYSFSGGTAKPGTDYTPVSGTLTFGSKETSKKINMKIFNNTSASGDKTVLLTLKNPTGSVSLGQPATVTLTIRDPNAPASSVSAASSAPSSDTMITLSATSYGVMENGGSAIIIVNRTGVTTTAVGVNYSTTNGSATSGTDYTAVTGTLSFASGETTKSFAVPVANNANIEGNRTFNVILSSPTGGAALGTLTAPVAINDDEAVPMGSGSVKFSSSTYIVTEGQGKANITINRVGSLSAVSVNYATSNGSAISGSDYTVVSGTMSFAAGETSKVFVVPVNQDALSEGEETVNLTLSGPTNNVPLSDPSVATLKIQE